MLDESSGLIRLRDPIPAEELRPRMDWISYQEPETHLDSMLSQLVSASGLRPGARILGVSRYDKSAIDGLARLGFKDGLVLDSVRHLGLPATSGTESVQAEIRPAKMRALQKEIGRFDLIVARYIFEHAPDSTAFCDGLSLLLTPTGLIALEMPDFTPSLETGEYCNVWEEHIFYFTPASLRRFFSDHGFDILTEQMYPYPLENSFIVLVRPSRNQTEVPEMKPNLELARRFGAQFPTRKNEIRASLERLGPLGSTALLGAGHLGTKFINLMEVSDLVSFVADDHPKKCGFFMPGSRLPIRPSRELLEGSIQTCLLSVRPEREEAALNNISEFVGRGGKAYSIFSGSGRALPL
jgi:hypothetical protein